jgi:signal transduction histidine kinase
MLITLGLVGLVLFTVLAASVISSYQSEAKRIETAVSQAITRDDSDSERPWDSGQGNEQLLTDLFAELQRHNPLLSREQGDTQQPYNQEQNLAILPGKGPFTPVYIALVNRSSGFVILSDNSSSVFIEGTLADGALTRIEERLPPRGSNQNADITGLLFDLKLFYRAVSIGDEGMIVALADASSLIDSTFRMAASSALIWLGAMIILFAISLLLSRMALRPVAEAWERQRRFIADASHELKTPLTVILANNSLLLAHPDKTVATQQKWVDSTQAEAQRMDSLVRDLLLLAQTDEEQRLAKSGAPSQRAVDLSALIRRNLLQFEAVFFERGITLTAEIEDKVTVLGNEEQLGRLVQILLDNASKYAGTTTADKTADKAAGEATDRATIKTTDEAAGAADQGGTATPDDGHRPVQTQATVHVRLYAGSDARHRATLKIMNNGDVIDPEALPHLFERFYRADCAHSDTEGSGLGLSLAQAIVEAHHGSIGVTSNITDGTVFTVVL